MQPRALFLVASLVYLASPFIITFGPARPETSSYDTQANRQARNASAFAQMLGEFRTSLGDMLFVKTERYLDSGIGYEPHIDSREMEAEAVTSEQALDQSLGNSEMANAATIKPGQVQSESDHNHDHHGHDHDHDHDHDHGGVNTLIRTAHTDFRGFIGHLEREVKPWRDPSLPHQHTAGTELLPWYRLATLSDPHNVRNYMIGAWWLKSLNKPEQREEALKFLDEGITANPNAYELFLMKGYVLRKMEQDNKALENFHRSAQLALKQRPPGPFKETPDWDLTDDEQMLAAMTMEINIIRDSQSTASAVQALNNYQEALPHEGGFDRLRMELDPKN